jgi:rhodanese-related sulfurtransferase
MSRVICAFVVFLFTPIASAWAADGTTEIDIPAAKSLYDKGVVFIDARSERSFKNKGHIAGAFNLTEGSKDFTEANLLKLAAKDQPVVFYCNCASGSCNISPDAAKDAVDMGYQEVYYFKEGTYGWSKAGYAVEKSE